MRALLGIFLAAVVATTLYAPPVGAEPMLSVQPLQYREELSPGERKKAFMDVTNPSAQAVTVHFSVQGFRQVGEEGDLKFYDDERLRSGVLLDHEEVIIPAYKTLRLYFVVDGSKLPEGDVFAVIFAKTKPEQGVASPSVRLGTLLILTNGSPGARDARIEALNAPLLQTGDSLQGSVKIRNTAPPNSASGFFPEIKISSWPFGPSASLTGPLVYAGNTRTVDFKLPSSQLGVFKLQARHGDSVQKRWIVVVTGVWRWVSITMVLVLVGGIGWWLVRRHRRGARQK